MKPPVQLTSPTLSLVGFAIWSACIASSFARASSTEATILKPPLVSAGIKNLGNTCYLNAQLECAFHIPLIRKLTMEPVVEEVRKEDPVPAAIGLEEDEMSEEEEITGTEASEPNPIVPTDSVARQALRGFFAEMIEAAAQPNSVAPAPRSFCLQLGIPPMVQQDSQEFWKLLLPALEDERFSDLYKGSFEDYITALDGSGRERRREELFLDLSLDVDKSTTLMDSLKNSFGTPETLSVAEGNGWRPEKGAEKVDAHKESALIAKGLPSILQFHLKRFTYNWQTDTMNKVNSRLAFPVELDMSKLCKPVEGEEDIQSLTQYDLQSIVIHVGEYGVGHYYAYVRPDISEDRWYRFNDDIVDEVSQEEVFDDAFGGKVQSATVSKPQGFWGRVRRILPGGHSSGGNPYGWGGETSNAYVLQYVRRGDSEKLYCREESSTS